ncbi:MAG: hypothetical protein CVV27_08725 [Candidatus Melainabacteria bacterium HGW-Melainabacteria-1]|nr:MAG: hypothetical protein CVV27_08725 [Candidatus Melainabacteria bacterium HGW-Melainabacteria-1]
MPNINKTPQTAIDKAQTASAAKAAAKGAGKAAEQVAQKTSGKGQAAELCPSEKVAVKSTAEGTANCLVCIVDDETLQKAGELGKKVGEKISDTVKEHYKNPPEKQLIDKTKDFLSDVGDTLEEFADDVVDGRLTRDIGKGAKRFWRDNFTEQSPTDKFKNKIKDAAEDTVDAAADVIDDIKDGRLQKKVVKAFKD